MGITNRLRLWALTFHHLPTNLSKLWLLSCSIGFNRRRQAQSSLVAKATPDLREPPYMKAHYDAATVDGECAAHQEFVDGFDHRRHHRAWAGRVGLGCWLLLGAARFGVELLSM
jgi:hypothetical protein